MNAAASPIAPAPVAPAAAPDRADAPWWRHGHVWLIISGPVAVVLAGLATAWIAWGQPDPLVTQPARMPAVKARNHAADPQAALRSEAAASAAQAR
jgi:hypothetical protein